DCRLDGVGKKLRPREQHSVGPVIRDSQVSSYPGVCVLRHWKIFYESAAIVGGIHLRTERELFEVIEAGHLPAARLGLVQGWQQQGGEYGNDRDDNQHFDESEAVASCPRRGWVVRSFSHRN